MHLSYSLLALGLLAGCSGTAADGAKISGTRALGHVQEMVRFGPHPPGSDAQFQVGNYLIEVLRSQGLETQTYTFQPVTPQGPLKMRNIWGIVPGQRDEILLIASHYDSKLYPQFPFVGANDGGSSSGLLLELARVLSGHNPTSYTLWFVFFDGEEAIAEWTEQDSLYGSREFVAMLRRKKQLEQVRAMILLDLVGGSPLRLRRDSNSSSWLNDLIWKKAAELGYEEVFLSSGSTAAQDDHIPFARAGIPVVDLIDLEYRYWHTPEDTLDKLSAQSLETVGEVVLASLPEIAAKLERP